MDHQESLEQRWSEEAKLAVSVTLINSSMEGLEPLCLASVRTQVFQATEAVAMQIAKHQLHPMDPTTHLRERTTKDRPTCAPANERIDLNRKIKEHKVLIIEGSTIDVGLYLIIDGATD